MTNVNHPQLVPGQIWQHYKGKHYKIIVLGKHSETGEELIAYQRQEDGHIYFRHLDLFFQSVELEGKVVPRFILTKQ
jgi:hypothetical protein